MRSLSSEALATDAPRSGASMELQQLKAAIDAACRELGLGLAGLDVPKREVLVKRAIGIARTYAAGVKKA
jgi:hypothetical protein